MFHVIRVNILLNIMFHVIRVNILLNIMFHVIRVNTFKYHVSCYSSKYF